MPKHRAKPRLTEQELIAMVEACPRNVRTPAANILWWDNVGRLTGETPMYPSGLPSLRTMCGDLGAGNAEGIHDELMGALVTHCHFTERQARRRIMIKCQHRKWQRDCAQCAETARQLKEQREHAYAQMSA